MAQNVAMGHDRRALLWAALAEGGIGNRLVARTGVTNRGDYSVERTQPDRPLSSFEFLGCPSQKRGSRRPYRVKRIVVGG